MKSTLQRFAPNTTGLLLICCAILAVLVFGVERADPASAGTGLVPEAVRTDLPVAVDGTAFDLEQMGNRVVVAGSFTSVRPGIGETPIPQKYLYAYDINTGELDRNFLPTIDREVERIIPAPDGSALYLVGRFNSIDGHKARKIARIKADGTVDTAFRANANSKATAVAISPDGQRLFVGGRFTEINGVSRLGLAELNAATGAVVDTFDIPLEGGVGVGGTLSVKGLDVTPDGKTLVALTTARFVGGEERWGPATINIGAATAAVNPWRTTLFEDNRDRVGGQFWFRGFDTSPDGSYFVVTTSGGDRPPTNDVAIRFPVAGGNGVVPAWITRNFDSTYSAAIDDDVIYVGGHFRYTEAPGAPNPYPGDPNISFGWGGDRVASELGNAVIARHQIAALDPATGHALGWDPGANGFNGVYELEVIDRGLLLGHDGDIVGDKPVGRAAFFDRANPGNGNNGGGDAGGNPDGGDVDPPDLLPSDVIDTVIAAPVDGGTIGSGSVSVSGLAAAPAGISKVQVTVYDLAAKTWLQPNGTFASPWSATIATLDGAVGDTSLRWSVDVQLAADRQYEIKAKVFDQAKGKDPDQPRIRVRSVEGEGAAPGGQPLTLDTTIDSPLTGGEFAIGETLIQGTATAPAGVKKVQVTVLNLASRDWLQPDGSFGPNWAGNVATLDATVGSTSVNWSLPVQFSEIAGYEIKAKVFDEDKGKDPAQPRIRVNAVGGDADAPPSSAISAITLNEEAKTLTAVGAAFDDVGVDELLVAVRWNDPGVGQTLYLRPDGSLGDYYPFPAELANRGATGTNWTVTVPQPANFNGTLTFEANAIDVAGQKDPSTRARRFVIGDANADVDEAPVAEIAQAPLERSAGDAFVLSGTATDDKAVSSVSVLIRNVTTGQGLQLGGTIAGVDGNPAWVKADLANPGAASTSWSIDIPGLPPGKYSIRVSTRDDANQTSEVTQSINVRAEQGDQFPSGFVGAPAAGTQPNNQISVSGLATDDSGVARVEVGFYFRGATGVRAGWLNADGVITSKTAYRDATLETPDGTSTNWTLPTVALPSEGNWQIRVRTWDDNGQPSITVPVHAINFGQAVEVIKPTLEVQNLQDGATVSPGTVAINGVIRDDQQVRRVRYLVRRAHVNEGPNLGGNTQIPGWFEGFVTQPGGTRSNFALTTPELEPGKWSLYIGGYDNENNYTQIKLDLTVGDTNNVAPQATIVAPTRDITVAGQSIALTGTAFDDVSVKEVRVLVYDFTTRQYVLADGSQTPDPSLAYRPANLANAGSKSTAWSFDFSADDPGRYQFYAFAYDDAGMRQTALAYTRVWLSGENESPVVEVLSPAAGAVTNAAEPLTLTAVATDDAGISRVQYYIRRTTVDIGPNPNPFVTKAGWFDVPLTAAQVGSKSIPFTVSADVEPGAYLVYIQATDTNGTSTRIRHDVTLNFAGNAAPDSTIVSPANGSADQDDLTVDVAGTATDDSGVAEVRFAVYNWSKRQYLMPNGTLTPEPQKALQTATLSAQGAVATDWTGSFTVPTDLEGYYQLQVFAYDDSGMVQIANRYHRFHVTPGDVAPVAAINSPAANTTVAPGLVTLAGVATDDVGVDRIQYYVQRTNVNEGPNPNPFTTTAGWFDVSLTAAQKGSTSVAYSVGTDLEPGGYLAYVQVTDTTGKTHRLRRDFDVNVANNVAPDSRITSPTWNSRTQDDLVVEMTGTATDDSGVTEVRFAVYNWAKRQYMMPDGTFTSEPRRAYQTATLSNAGATSTNWTGTFTVPEGDEGYYQVQVFAYDASGMVQTASRYVRFYITPGENQ